MVGLTKKHLIDLDCIFYRFRIDAQHQVERTSAMTLVLKYHCFHQRSKLSHISHISLRDRGDRGTLHLPSPKPSCVLSQGPGLQVPDQRAGEKRVVSHL